MAEQRATVRVLLLARAGEARQRLESALADAGAELVAAVDPAEGDAAAITALAPAAVLVALEPAIEDALERYDVLLSDPAVLVMFDEADVAAQRDGWDAARWVRHLAAKLNGHQDVLPPGADPEEAVHPAPGSLPQNEFDPSSIDIDALADAAQDLAADVPRDDVYDAPLMPGPADAMETAEPVQADPVLEEGDRDDSITAARFEGLVAAEDMDWSSSSGAADELSLADDPGLAALLADGAGTQAAGAQGPGTPDDDRASESGLAWEAEADTGLDAGFDLVIDPDAAIISDADTDADAAIVAGVAGVDPLSLGDGLSLVEDDSVPHATRSGSVPELDLDALASRLDGLSLADPDSYGHGALRGAVVVEAGLGGPDAVRQLLGGLQQGFARAILVRLQLDGGRYERLVQQMQRATALPVALAEVGSEARPGTVHFLPPEVGVMVDRARLVFVAADQSAGDYASLPASDSAVVFLSGAQTALVDSAMDLAAAGALVFAQAAASCYDSAAVDALLARGAVSAEPADLAQVLLDRWP